MQPAKDRKRRKRGAADANKGIDTFRYHTHVRGLFLGVVWNVFSWMIALVAWVELAGFWWRGIVFVAPAIGVPLGVAAARRYIRYRRDGVATLFVEPRPPRIGEPFQATFVSAKAPAEGRVFKLRIRCERREYGGDDVSIKQIWAMDRLVAVSNGVAATEIRLPDDLPHGHALSTDVSYAWVINLDRGGYRQDFDLPMAESPGSKWDLAELADVAAAARKPPAMTRARDRARRPPAS